MSAIALPNGAGAFSEESPDDKVKVSTNDTTPDYLSPKITAGINIAKTILNPGANETVEIASNYPSSNFVNNAIMNVLQCNVGAARANVITNTSPNKLMWFLRGETYIEAATVGTPSSGQIGTWIDAAALQAMSLNFGGTYVANFFDTLFLRPGESVQMQVLTATGGSTKGVITVGSILLPNDLNIVRLQGTVSNAYATVMNSGRLLDFSWAKQGQGTPAALIFNNDTVNHTYEWRITNGVSSVYLQRTGAVTPGVTSQLACPVNLDASWAGWTLQLKMLEAVTTTAPSYTLINVPSNWVGPA